MTNQKKTKLIDHFDLFGLKIHIFRKILENRSHFFPQQPSQCVVETIKQGVYFLQFSQYG